MATFHRFWLNGHFSFRGLSLNGHEIVKFWVIDLALSFFLDIWTLEAQEVIGKHHWFSLTKAGYKTGVRLGS